MGLFIPIWFYLPYFQREIACMYNYQNSQEFKIGWPNLILKASCPLHTWTCGQSAIFHIFSPNKWPECNLPCFFWCVEKKMTKTKKKGEENEIIFLRSTNIDKDRCWRRMVGTTGTFSHFNLTVEGLVDSIYKDDRS